MVLSQSALKNRHHSRIPRTGGIARRKIILAVPEGQARAHFLGLSTFPEPRSVTAPLKLKPSPGLTVTGRVLSLSSADISVLSHVLQRLF